MEQESIIKNKSSNFYISSLLFPKDVRQKTFILYGFVRVIDDLIDRKRPKVNEYKKMKTAFYDAYKGNSSNNTLIDDFAKLSKEYEKNWIDAFFDSIEMDIEEKKYATIKDLKKYLYGIAEVIGLMMSVHMKLPSESYHSARMLGRSMQFGNMIRDIAEDEELGRRYIPRSLLKKHNIKNISKNEAGMKPLILEMIEHYQLWQSEAEKGFSYIPKRYIIPIKTASDNYKWTMRIIKKNPLVVFDKKVKPSKYRIILHILLNILQRPVCAIVSLVSHLKQIGR